MKGMIVMPLSMVMLGEESTIKNISGKDETKRFLANLGFVTGSKVTVVNEVNGNLIVNVKNNRIAIGKNLANKIYI